MTISIGGAIRTALIAESLPGVTGIYRDFAPPSAEKPYITYFDEITNITQMEGDKKVLARLRQVQVDLWQDKSAENVGLIDSLVDSIDGIGNLGTAKFVYKVKVSDIQRMVSSEDNLVHHAITLDVYTKA